MKRLLLWVERLSTTAEHVCPPRRASSTTCFHSSYEVYSIEGTMFCKMMGG